MSRFFKKTNKLQIESKPLIESIHPNVIDLINNAFRPTASPNIVGPNEQMENDSTAQPPKENDVGRAPPGRQRRNNWMCSPVSIGHDEAYYQEKHAKEGTPLDVSDKEKAVKELETTALLYRKHHVKQKASAATAIWEELNPQKASVPAFPPQEIELCESGRSSNEHYVSLSSQDTILPQVQIATNPTQNASYVPHPTLMEVGTQGGSQHSLSHSTSMVSNQEPETKNYFKLVCGMFTISCGGFITVLVDLPGKNSHDHHKVFLKSAYTLCVYSSCIICLCVIAVYFLCPHTTQVARIVKFLAWIVLATVAYALALITCLATPLDVPEEAAILVLPVLPIGLVGLIRAKYKST